MKLGKLQRVKQYVERVRHVTLTVHKFIQDGGQYKLSVSEGRRF